MSAAVTVDEEDVDPRDVRAAREYLAVVEIVPGLFHVYSEAGTEYAVDVGLGSCTCPDFQYRNATCKHIRRVEMERGERAVPAGIRLDPFLVDPSRRVMLDEQPRRHRPDDDERRRRVPPP